MAATCGSCGEEITDVVLTAFGMSWHPYHLACNTCGKDFSDGSTPGMNSFPRQPYRNVTLVVVSYLFIYFILLPFLNVSLVPLAFFRLLVMLTSCV